MFRHRRRLHKRRANRRIALGRIIVLFDMAKKAIQKDPELAQSYVKRARKIGMRYNVRLPTEFRRMICRTCKSFIIPGINCRVRIRQKREPHVVITCLVCNGIIRIPISRTDHK